MRVLMTADAVGGVWTYALDLARGLAPHGVETILAVTGPSPSEDQLRAAGSVPSLTLLDTGLPLDWLVQSEAELIEAGEAVFALASKQRVDLIHLNTPALAAGHSIEMPTIAATHSCTATWWDAVRTGPLPTDFAWRKQLHAAGLNAADAVLAPSAAFADDTARAYGIRPHVVHNGGNPSTRAPLPTDDSAFAFGRLWDPGKDAATLDAAAALLSVPLFAAGATTGPDGDAVKLRHSQLLGHLTGEQLVTRLAARPVFVSAARYEPFGLSVLEAATAGCALVLSDIPTFRELWDGCAIFVPPGDAPAFAAALEALIADPTRRQAQGRGALIRAGRYTVDAMAAATLAIYRTVLPAAAKAAA